MRVPIHPSTRKERTMTRVKAIQSRFMAFPRHKLLRRFSFRFVNERAALGGVLHPAALDDSAERPLHLLQAANLVLDVGDLRLGPLPDVIAFRMGGERQLQEFPDFGEREAEVL